MTINVTVVYSPSPRVVHDVAVSLPDGSSVLKALEASRVLAQFPGIAAARPAVGVWGKKVGLQHLLIDGDRLEIYRGLRVDPKVARRERFVKQGARSTGLFAKKRKGAKAGY